MRKGTRRAALPCRVHLALALASIVGSASGEEGRSFVFQVIGSGEVGVVRVERVIETDNGSAEEGTREIVAEVEAAVSGRSERLATQPADTLVFSVLGSGTGEGREPWRKVGEVPVAGMERAVFLIYRIADEEERAWEVQAIDMSPDHRRGGELLVFNGSGSIVGVELPECARIAREERPAVAAPGEAGGWIRVIPGALLAARCASVEGLNRPSPGEYGVVTVDAAFAVSQSGKNWQPLRRDLLGLRSGEVRVVVFSPPAVSGSHRLQSSVFSFLLDGRLAKGEPSDEFHAEGVE